MLMLSAIHSMSRENSIVVVATHPNADAHLCHSVDLRRARGCRPASQVIYADLACVRGTT